MTFLNPLDLMRDRPESTSEDVHYGKTLDPKQQKDPKKLGRVRVRVPELDGEAGSGIPDEHLPLTQLERHENYGTQEEMSHFQMPQKDAHVIMRFHATILIRVSVQVLLIQSLEQSLNSMMRINIKDMDKKTH